MQYLAEKHSGSQLRFVNRSWMKITQRQIHCSQLLIYQARSFLKTCNSDSSWNHDIWYLCYSQVACRSPCWSMLKPSALFFGALSKRVLRRRHVWHSAGSCSKRQRMGRWARVRNSPALCFQVPAAHSLTHTGEDRGCFTAHCCNLLVQIQLPASLASKFKGPRKGPNRVEKGAVDLSWCGGMRGDTLYYSV